MSAWRLPPRPPPPPSRISSRAAWPPCMLQLWVPATAATVAMAVAAEMAVAARRRVATWRGVAGSGREGAGQVSWGDRRRQRRPVRRRRHEQTFSGAPHRGEAGVGAVREDVYARMRQWGCARVATSGDEAGRVMARLSAGGACACVHQKKSTGSPVCGGATRLWCARRLACAHTRRGSSPPPPPPASPKH